MNDTTEIALILDQSGSMQSIKAGTIEGVNGFLLKQKEENGKYPVRMNLTLFSTAFEIRYSSLPVTEVPQLDDKSYQPNGGTALLDAIGMTVEALGKRLAETPETERPGTVIVAIMTDGEENSSERFSWKQISDMIKHQTEIYKWRFLFLGANQDAIATASKMNIAADSSVTYFQRDGSSRSALRAMSSRVCHYKVRASSAPNSMSELYAEEEAKSDSGK